MRLPITCFLAALLSGSVSVGCGPEPVRAEAHQIVDQGARLVDVRSAVEFASGHVEGAVNIPLDQLPERMSELGSQDQAIVVYCRSGQRSASAKRTLEAAGYRDVFDLGAMSRW